MRGGHRTRRGTETFPLVSASVLGGWGREVAEEAFRGNRRAGLLLLTAGYCIQLLTEASVSSKPGGRQGVRVLALKQESTAFPYVSRYLHSSSQPLSSMPVLEGAFDII